MFISSFQLHNYKSYRTSQRVSLTSGFNIITGQNNAGKTALLEALSLNFPSKPHRSLEVQPTPDTKLNQQSSADVSFTVSSEELRSILFVPSTDFYIPVPAENTSFSKSIGMDDYYPESMRRLVEWVLSHDELTFNVRITKLENGEKWSIPRLPSFGLYDVPSVEGQEVTQFVKCTVATRGTYTNSQMINTSKDNELGLKVAQYIRDRIYSFRAERLNNEYGYFGNNIDLRPNAENLAQVLNVLQGNSFRFKRFNKTVRQVLPQIQWVSVRPYAGHSQGLEILVWTTDPASERIDLAIPLSESGTGISQVLAILYVVLNSDYPRTIIIDEPQSFLHPGAVRKLIEILKGNSQHQFILSTHSPNVITAANPETITVVRQQGSESILESLSVNETEQMRLYLSDIGARLSDVFGADNILWVEGRTEEICFPIILEKIVERSLMGTAIIGVKHTGDLEGRHAKTVFEIYERLSQGKGLLPPAIGFIFDKEGRSDKEQEDIRRQSRNRVHFTQRRLYENYLLNPEAIRAVFNDQDRYRDSPVTGEEVTAKIDEKKKEAKYYKPFTIKESETGNDWLTYVHGAQILIEIFSEFSEGRVKYDKVVHSKALTEWIAHNAPDDLRDIADLINNALSNSDIVT